MIVQYHYKDYYSFKKKTFIVTIKTAYYANRWTKLQNDCQFGIHMDSGTDSLIPTCDASIRIMQ